MRKIAPINIDSKLKITCHNVLKIHYVALVLRAVETTFKGPGK